MKENKFVSEIIATLNLLSSDANIQTKYLEDIGGGSVDELALELDDLARLAPSMLEAGTISLEQLHSIEAVASQLEAMSGETGMWSTETLSSSGAWVKVRALANQALAKFS